MVSSEPLSDETKCFLAIVRTNVTFRRMLCGISRRLKSSFVYLSMLVSVDQTVSALVFMWVSGCAY